MGYKKVIIQEFGDAGVVEVVEENQLPEPGAGEVRIKVEASSAVFTDMLIRRNLYPAIREKPPITLGYDLIGVVDELGPDVTGLSAGQRVADLTQIGGNAEYVVRPADGLVPVPESLDAAEAESIPLSYMTAYQMLVRVANVRPGQRILIQGATGAVGTALLQLGSLLGVEMVGTASARNHDLISEYGATPIDYRSPDYGQQLRKAAGAGFDVVFEGSGSEISRRLVKRGGILVSYGFTGTIRDKSGSRLGLGLATAAGFSGVFLWSILPNGKSWNFYDIAGTRKKHLDWFREDSARLFGWMESGEIKPVIAQRFSIDEAPRAHDLLDKGSTRGRLAMVMH